MVEKNKLDYLDDSKTIEEKRLLYSNVINKKMNPVPEKSFNPETFDPLGDNDMNLIANRKRTDVPKILPTFGLKPKEIREGQMIGMFESKQDLYLIMAHRINQLQEEIELLKTKIK